jgi:hypothetical protein
MKQTTLPARHYAAGWKTEGALRPLAEVNDLGRRYAELPADAPEKEALLLELCQCFHPYLMKYLVMICRGHVPVMGRGDKGAPINKDIKPFLLYFLPKGESLNWHTMNRIVKHFHLAFKGMETEEIYDVLMEQLVATIKGYDPTYTEKVKLLVEAIEMGYQRGNSSASPMLTVTWTLIAIAISACWAALASSSRKHNGRPGA